MIFQECYLCPCPATMSAHSFFPVISKLDSLGQEGSKVTWSGCSRSLVLEKGLPEFADFRLFVYVSMGGMSGKHSAELKTPRRWGQHLWRWNQRQSERFYQTSAESLEVAFTLRLFLRKKARRVILCFSVQNDQGKKVWDNRIWTRQVPSWFCIRDIALLAMAEKEKKKYHTNFCLKIWESAGRRWPGGVVGTNFSCSGNWLRARVLHHWQFRLVCRHEQAKLCGREQLKCLCAVRSWDIGHSCHRALLCGTLFLCLSPSVPPPRLFSLALTLISSLIYIVLVSDLQQRRWRFFTAEKSEEPWSLILK